jgi:predicted 3-demethylubiquinone-9 3-methyltransferase (glyoxalase superfamily)
MQKIVPNLWFDNQAEEAVKFYISLIENSSGGTVARYGDAGPGPKGSVMTIAFRIAGQEFVALNGGPMYTFSPAIALS